MSVAVNCGIGYRQAQIPSCYGCGIGWQLPWEPSYSAGAALKRQKKKNKINLKIENGEGQNLLSEDYICLMAFQFNLNFSTVWINLIPGDIYYSTSICHFTL